MSARLTALFVGCAIAHVAVDGLVASPWLVPDVTFVGLVLVVVHRPSAWWAVSLGAGVLAAAGAVRAPQVILGMHLAAGWALALLSREWDLLDRRLQGGLAAVLTAAMTAGLISLDGAWSWALAGRLLLRAAVTVAVWALARRLVDRVVSA